MINATNATADLTLEQQAALGSGGSFWATKTVGPAKPFTLTDGPHGVRKQNAGDDHLGIAPSMPATCFPPAVGLAQTWDADLVESVAIALGAEALERGVGVLLGPGVNIKRDPRCGRNFEYFSEDPIVSGILGAAWVNGLQSQGVGASVKHFAANNAEHDRMRSSSDVDPRTLREIYLRPFQRVVEDARPWTVMCSYNRINGVFASESKWLLTDVLRGEWGYEGAVISDWGAVRNRVRSVAAGVDLEMPGGTNTDALVVEAVDAGVLEPGTVQASAERTVALASLVEAGRLRPAGTDVDAHHALARDAATRSIVLLKNDDALLPLEPSGSIAVIGEFAEHPRFQGGGSSRVNPTRVDIPLTEIRARAGSARVTYAPGFSTQGTEDSEGLRSAAVRTAAAADVAVVFLGLGDRQESEGFDRSDIEIPADQLHLLTEIAAAQPSTVVVLSHGGVLRLSAVIDLVPAILDGGLLGQGGGAAIADTLFGLANPSGRLTETIPVRLEDSPAFLNFPGENAHTLYGEGQFVGYRWYDARRFEVSFPFGHGLSYTSFEYSALAVSAEQDGIEARVTVRNVGARAGREIVQFYTSKIESAVTRPLRELKAFTTVHLRPEESSEVTVRIRREDLAYWDIRIDDWVIEGGNYVVAAGASSRDIRQSTTVEIAPGGARVPITLESTVGEVLEIPAAAAILGELMADSTGNSDAAESALGIDLKKMMASFPLSQLVAFRGDDGRAILDRLLEAANNR